MGLVKCLLLAAVCIQVSSMPLSTQLSEEEEKVTRCIMEVLAESLSTQGSERVSSGCIRLLREDERLISILRHQHLLKELEDLSHREKSQQHAGQESSEEEELRKRTNESPVPAPKRDTQSKRGTENEESKEFEKIEKVEVKQKEHGTSVEEKAHELLEEEEDKRSPAVKRDDSHGKRAGDVARDAAATKRKDMEKKNISDESEDDSSEEEHGRGYNGNSKGWYQRDHDEWEKRKRGSQRRMAEDPSQEETAQFETEDRRLKYLNSKNHMHGYPHEEKRHIHHPEEDMDRERNYYGPEEDEMGREIHHHNGRPGNHEHREEEEERELEEMEEREEHRAEERDIQEVEEELRKAAEHLQEIHRG
ncbi:coiled-coil domain-containing glutamate-rich protein 2 [Rana temporaria]|uniref:coiled-coil domain-containing glutamate-rich protein 2 n=1 Tax=Rana temporaria TaxID=8407 RepID=UPI001AADFB3F|nr:coiled-coil domain-containing glutamate-rich protein 2 [Rana temporaria]